MLPGGLDGAEGSFSKSSKFKKNWCDFYLRIIIFASAVVKLLAGFIMTFIIPFGFFSGWYLILLAFLGFFVAIFYSRIKHRTIIIIYIIMLTQVLLALGFLVLVSNNLISSIYLLIWSVGWIIIYFSALIIFNKSRLLVFMAIVYIINGAIVVFCILVINLLDLAEEPFMMEISIAFTILLLIGVISEIMQATRFFLDERMSIQKRV